jgi:hypothetical protein
VAAPDRSQWRIKREVRWLEKTAWKEEWQGNGEIAGWVTIEWIDEEKK